MIDIQQRCQCISGNLSLIQSMEYDTETQKRLKHNHEHFFDQSLVESVIERQIVEPLIEYAQT